MEVTFAGLCFTDSPGSPFRHDMRLVLLSCVVAAIGSYSALAMAERRRESSGAAAIGWATGSALALAGGIWSMHFIGMLAFATIVPVSYDMPTTLASLVIAVVFVAGGLYLVRESHGGMQLLLAGIAVGLGVAAMHYTGMSALQFQGTVAYRPGLWFLSVAIAIAAATAALHLARRPRVGWHGVAAAVVMAIAIAGMHYVGMAATVIRVDAMAIPGTGMANAPLAITVAVVMLGLLAMAVTSVFADRRVAVAAADALRSRHTADRRQQEFEVATAALLRTTPDAVVISNAQGRIVAWNPGAASLFGWTEAEAALLNIADLMPHDMRPAHAAGMARHRETGETRIVGRMVEVPGLHKDGSELTLELSLAHWQIDGHSLYGGVLRDVSARHAAAAELRRAKTAAEAAERLKASLLANLSHELRTPLHAILGFADLLADPAATADPGYADYVSEIQHAGRRLFAMVNGVLDLSDLQSGTQALEFAVLRATDVAREALRLSQAAAQPRRVELVLDATTDSSLVADERRLRLALKALLDNALRYAPPDSEVRLAVRRMSEDLLEFAVSDRGPGWPTATPEALIAPFVQADATLTRRHEGAGLGLAIVRAVADRHYGHLVLSPNPEGGACAILRLPIATRLTQSGGH